MEVNVISPPVQRYAVWFGGSWLGDTVRPPPLPRPRPPARLGGGGLRCHEGQAACFSFFVQPEFYHVAKTKAQYDEYGPSICRHNAAFGSGVAA